MEIKTPEGNFEYTSLPDTCPLCNHGIEPKLIGSNFVEARRVSRYPILQLFFRCPRIDCQEAFIGYYQQQPGRSFSPSGPFYLKGAAPFNVEAPKLPPEVAAVSENFVLTYTQSHAAEYHHLDQVAGAGYRKSLEYLVKDYCISRYPEKVEAIKNTWLATCIETYIDDANIKSCALRAAWLGNDETHYVRKWEEKDINDLKILIELTIGWIRNHLLTEKYNREMK